MQAYQKFAAEIIAAYAQETEPNCARMMSTMPPEEAEIIAAVLGKDLPGDDPEKVVSDCIRRIRRIETEAELERLGVQLADSTKTVQQKQEIMLEIQRLNRELRG